MKFSRVLLTVLLAASLSACKTHKNAGDGSEGGGSWSDAPAAGTWSAAITFAKSQLGKPYQSGGTGPR